MTINVSKKTIGKRCGLSERGVTRMVSSLAKKDYIKIISRGYKKSNEYEVNLNKVNGRYHEIFMTEDFIKENENIRLENEKFVESVLAEKYRN